MVFTVGVVCHELMVLGTLAPVDKCIRGGGGGRCGGGCCRGISFDEYLSLPSSSSMTSSSPKLFSLNMSSSSSKSHSSTVSEVSLALLLWVAAVSSMGMDTLPAVLVLVAGTTCS